MSAGNQLSSIWTVGCTASVLSHKTGEAEEKKERVKQRSGSRGRGGEEEEEAGQRKTRQPPHYRWGTVKTVKNPYMMYNL